MNILPLNILGGRSIADEDITSFNYFDLVNNAFNLTSAELTLLETNQFIVLNRLGTDDILDAYRYYWEQDLPIIITTDTMLQTWHLIFDHALERVEEIIFFPIMQALALEMKERFIEQITVDTDDVPVNDILVYLSVAAKLADSTVIIPSSVADPVNAILDAIYNEITIFEAIEQFQTRETQRFIDDFSMYRPRGHYTKSTNLETYFRLFKWFSRIPFFMDTYPGVFYLQRSPEQMIRASAYLLYSMKNSYITINDLEIVGATGLEIWQGIKHFIDVMVGETYTVTPIMMDNIIKTVMGNNFWHPDEIQERDIQSIQNQVLGDSSIPAPKDAFIIDALVPLEFWPPELRVTVTSCKSLLLFGERLTLDTYAGNHLVYPFVKGPWIDAPDKYFPNGLEFAATIFQSERANNFLSTINHSQYQSQLLNIRKEIEAWPSEEKQTLSWKWMEALKFLTPSQPGFNESKIPVIPEFMKTEAWLDEKLTSVLGSWAQLKHDTILYGKQGLTLAVCSTPEGYVEPYPRFYNALGQLTQLFLTAITQLELIGFNSDIELFNSIISGGISINNILSNFTTVLTKLESIAYHELQGKSLSEEEKAFIKATYSRATCGSMHGQCEGGWLGELLTLLKFEYSIVSDQPNSRASLIADIHTDVNTEKILEVATGFMEHLIAILPGWNGTNILAVGPVFSYYEFIIPMEYRMTDDDWRSILFTSQDESLSQYYDFSIIPRGFWAQSYMHSTEMTTSVIYEEASAEMLQLPEWFVTESTTLDSGYPAELYIPPGRIQITSNPSPSHEETVSSDTTISKIPLPLISVVFALSLMGVSLTFRRTSS